MKVEISKRARRNSDRIHARWAKQGDDPSLYARELLEAIKHLETVGHPGTPWGTRKRPKMRRLLLEKSRCHLYFEVDETRDVLTLIAVWNGQRGHEPKL